MQRASHPLWLLVLLALPALTCQTVTGVEPRITPGILRPTGLPAPPSTARIVFTATGWTVPASSIEIFVMNTDGTGITAVSNSPGDDGEPSWSFDGAKIVFASRRDGDWDIYWMNADGTSQTQLTDTPEDEHDPSWSPAGDRILFARNDTANGDLWVQNLDGTGLTRLTNTPETREAYPDWSPDGSKIVFSAFGGGEAGIYTMNPDGSNVELIVGGPLHNPQWSPDGSEIAFDGEPGGNQFEVYIINADGSDMRQITHHPLGSGGYDKHPSWSPDGTQLVFWSDSRDAAMTEHENVFLINTDGTGEIQLTHSQNEPRLNYGGYDPDWSPAP